MNSTALRCFVWCLDTIDHQLQFADGLLDVPHDQLGLTFSDQAVMKTYLHEAMVAIVRLKNMTTLLITVLEKK